MQAAKRQLRLRLAGALALALLCLPHTGEATGVGSPVPKPTVANQYPVSAPYAGGFVWTPVTLPWLSNGSQTAFGGAIDTTSRVSVNPQGTSENGLTVKMPSGATGKPFQLKDSTGGNIFSVNANGSIATAQGFRLDTNNSPGFNAIATNAGQTLEIQGSQEGATGALRLGNPTGGLLFGGPILAGNGLATTGDILTNIRFYESYSSYLITALHTDGSLSLGKGITLNGDTVSSESAMLLVQNNVSGKPNLLLVPMSGQTADQMDYTGGNIAINGNITTPAFQSAIKTATSAYTLTATDTTILVSGAFAMTLPTASASLAGHSWTVKQIGAASSTLVGTIDGNTSGYTLAAQYNFCTFVCDGAAFYIVAKG